MSLETCLKKHTGVNPDEVALAQRFAQLMSEYNMAIGDGKISSHEAKRMLRKTLAIQLACGRTWSCRRQAA